MQQLELKVKLFEDVRSLHLKMLELMVYNGFEKQWTELVEELDKQRVSRIRFILNYLQEIHDTIWKDMYEIWTQPNLTSEMWENYKLFFDKPTLIEHKQMIAAAKRFKVRHTLFKEELRQRKKDEREGKVIDEADKDTIETTP